MEINQLFSLIDELKQTKDNILDFKDVKTLTFYRRPTGLWKGVHNWSTWKILLDSSKTKHAVRDAAGFRTLDKVINEQTVISTQGTKDILLAKNVKDRVVAEALLTTLAEKKYGK